MNIQNLHNDITKPVKTQERVAGNAISTIEQIILFQRNKNQNWEKCTSQVASGNKNKKQICSQ